MYLGRRLKDGGIKGGMVSEGRGDETAGRGTGGKDGVRVGSNG